MKIEKEYPFALPANQNKEEFLAVLRDVAKAVAKRKGVIKDYYEDDLLQGGAAGMIVVEEQV